MDRADVPEQLQGGRLLSEQQVFVFRVTDFRNNELMER